MALKYSFIKRRTIIILSLILVLVIAGSLGIKYLKEERSSSSGGNDEVMFNNMFSASRYFFRIGYDDDWNAETGLYGFYLDKEKGQVAELYPVREIDSGESEEHSGDRERIEGITVKIFHKDISNDNSEITPEKVIYELLTKLENTEGYVFGSPVPYETDNVKMYRVEYSYYEEGVNHKCYMYVAVRTMCEYVIITDCIGYMYDDYKNTIDKMIKDFRFSVFED